MSRRVLVSWSSGKGSACTLHVLRQPQSLEVMSLLTTFNKGDAPLPLIDGGDDVPEELPSGCPGIHGLLDGDQDHLVLVRLVGEADAIPDGAREQGSRPTAPPGKRARPSYRRKVSVTNPDYGLQPASS